MEKPLDSTHAQQTDAPAPDDAHAVEHKTPAPESADAQNADGYTAAKSQPIRAINEDDDGYDPYSDLHDRPAPEPLFERDPWD